MSKEICKTSKKEVSSQQKSGFSGQKDFEVGNNEERTRASSWDESDDDSPPVSEGSRAGRIFSNDFYKRDIQSITSEINALRKQFLEAMEREKSQKGHSTLRGELETLQWDRRKSPARRRRRTKSSENSSSFGEIENQISLENMQELNPLGFQFEGLPPKFLECSPAFYLNKLFSELRCQRISFIDPTSVVGREMPTYDRGACDVFSELNQLRTTNADECFSKTYKKLSRILEVDESKRDLEKKSEEKNGPLFIHQESKFAKGSLSPLQTRRSKIHQKSAEKGPETMEEKFQLTSPEYLKNYSRGSLSDRCMALSKKRDEESISLSAKIGKTHLPSLTWQEGKTHGQLFSPQSQDVCFEVEKKEKDFNFHESFKIDLMQNSGSPTPRKSTKRSSDSQKNGTTNEKSRSTRDLESPKFKLNLEGDSVKSLKMDDVDGPDNENRMQSEDRTSRKRIISSPGRRTEERTVRSSRARLANLEPVNFKSSKIHEGSKKISSSNKNRKQTINDEYGDSESTELNYSMHKSRSCSSESHKGSEKSHRSGKSYKSEEIGGPRGFKSSKISEFLKEKKAEGKPIDNSTPRTPGSAKIPEFHFPFNVSQAKDFQNMSNRSLKSVEFKEGKKYCNRLAVYEVARRNQKSSEHGLGSGSRSTEPKNSTPRSFETLLGRNGSENHSEFENSGNARLRYSKELEKTHANNNAFANSTSRTSLREFDVSNEQRSSRSEISIDSNECSLSGKAEEMENTDNLKIQLPGSTKSSVRSAFSQATELSQNSYAKSPKMKSRPSSWISTDHKSDVPTDVENIDGSTSRTFVSMAEDEEKESQLIHASNMEDENDRQFNKRLPIIDEVSFEDLNSRNDSSENEEKNCQGQSASLTKRRNEGGSPQSLENNSSLKKTQKTSNNSLKGRSDNEIGPNERIKSEEKWNELIEAFQNSNSAYKLEKNFPGFQDQKDISWDMIKESVLECKTYSECEEQISIPMATKNEENQFFEKSSPEKDLGNFSTGYKSPLSEKEVHGDEDDDEGIPQNIYFFNVSQRRVFRIGEFGDITNWKDAHFENKNFEKPRDHGDGTPTQKNPQFFARKTEKKGQEVKAQRPLRTELRKDKRESSPSLDSLLEDLDKDLTNFIPNDHETQKKENWIDKKRIGEIETEISTLSSRFTDFTDKPEVDDNKLHELSKASAEEKSASMKSTLERSNSAESSEEEDDAFLCKRSLRRSRSLSAVDTRLLDIEEQNEKKLFNVNEEKDITNLNIFLARKEEERIYVKSNNWLEPKSGAAGRSRIGRSKGGKKLNSKMKENTTPKTLFELSYLSPGKSHASIPNLKLKNTNCFQNFYKRFITAFCLTSNSSAATSE